MAQVSRRTVARGAAWSVPALALGAAAPAMAASPCSEIKLGSPLPASAFVPVYLDVTNQTFGGVANKWITVIAGVKLTAAAATCVGKVGLSLASSSAQSRIQLTNGTTYSVNTGTEGTGSGTTGVTNTGCSGGDSTAQVCITQTGMIVQGSSGTSSANPAKLSLTQMISVAGYGATPISINATSYALQTTNWVGSGLTITTVPTI